MAPPSFLTPAQLAVAAERRAAREAKRAAQAIGLDIPAQDGDGSGTKVLKREWIKVQAAGGVKDGVQKTGLRVISWNMLAQTLIRRDLFPGSDSLRWGDRKSMLELELAHYGRLADILCLQECDRLSDLIQAMPYDACVQAKGRGKQHGLVVAYRSERFKFRGSKTVYLDEEELSPSAPPTNGHAEGSRSWEEEVEEGRRKRGGTRQTKNVGLIVGLEDKGRKGEGEGVIIITAHLFWHPMYQYERVRQFIVLLRALRAFQKEHGIEAWPAIMAGDFNASPCEAPYQLLVSPAATLPPATLQRLEESRIIHRSVDNLALALCQPPPPSDGDNLIASESASANGTGANTPVPPTNGTHPESGSNAIDAGASATPSNGTQPESGSATATGANTPTAQPNETQPEKDDDGEGGGAVTESSAKSRSIEPEDGILSVAELQSAMQSLIGAEGLASAYDVAKWQKDGNDTFVSRDGWPEGSKGEKGGGEPGYTCFTALFKLTLDYLFIVPPAPVPSAAQSLDIQVRQVLRPAPKEELGNGLPMKGISASDHLAVGCEVAW